MALALPLKAPVVIVNVADLAPAGIVMDAGTVRMALLLARPINAPPLGAFLDRVTVQVADAFGPRVEGLQRSAGFARPTTTAASMTLVFTEKLL